MSSLSSFVNCSDWIGSERKKDVREHSLERIAEMQEINWSLGTLKQCVRDLIEKNSINPKKHRHTYVIQNVLLNVQQKL